MVRAPYVVFALVCLFGCGVQEGDRSSLGGAGDEGEVVSTPGASLPQIIVPLSTEELSEAIIGASIVEGHMVWTYCEDGVVHVSGTRAPYTRPYMIADGQVCIGGACSQVYRQGEFYYTRHSTPSSALMPVVLTRMPEGGGC